MSFGKSYPFLSVDAASRAALTTLARGDCTAVGLGPAAKSSTAIAIWLILAANLLSGCGKAASRDTTRRSVSSNAPQSAAVVELSPSQLAAIKIEPVGTYSFPVEKEAVGSVSFDEDPAIVQAESTLLAAAATFQAASKELARVEALGQSNGIAQKELEQATADRQTAQAALKAARDAVRALGKTDAEIDEMVAAGRIESAPAGRRWVVANVSESDSPLLRLWQPARVKVLAFPGRVFEGRIARIYRTVDPATHREAIRCAVEDPRKELRPGMLADVLIGVREPVEATAVPADAVVRESDGTMTAWVTADRRQFAQRVVQPGLRRDDRVQILAGLRRGELVVTAGAVFLSNMLNAPPGD